MKENLKIYYKTIYKKKIMNLTQRILFDNNNNNNGSIKVLLEQNIEKIEFLSLELSTINTYQNQNSDYGVLIGRVIANDGVGIPNAKVSIFIPISENDINNDELFSIYPYKTPRDKNNEGKRYNLLPRVSCINPNNGIVKPKQPFGSFPLKEEIVTNDILMDVYKKYYKYSTVTNNSGDYMIFGAPIGTQTVHMSVDVTDIGEYSMTPGTMITDLGYSPNLFTADKTEIKHSNDLSDLPNIETQEITVNIVPFWGNANLFEIGITRQDFRIRSTIKPSFVVFGSSFTDSDKGIWGRHSYPNARIGELYNADGGDTNNFDFTIGISTKRNLDVTESIYYYSNDVPDELIDSNNVNSQNDIKKLSKTEYTVYKNNGDFIFVIPCNRRKKITNENGILIDVEDNNPSGIFTEFRGFIVLENNDKVNICQTIGSDVNTEGFRYRLKFPQHSQLKTFRPYDIPQYSSWNDWSSYAFCDTERWRKQNYKFCYNKFYTLAHYHPITFNSSFADSEQLNGRCGFYGKTILNEFQYIINDVGVISTLNNNTEQFPSNYAYSYDSTPYTRNTPAFGLNWLHIGIYFPQLPKVTNNSNCICFANTVDYFSYQMIKHYDADDPHNIDNFNKYYLVDNEQDFVANEKNTCGFARSDIHWTDIVEVPICDIHTMNSIVNKGFYNHNILCGNYRNAVYIPQYDNDVINKWEGMTPLNCAAYYNVVCTVDTAYREQGLPNTSYFYKGHGNSDVIKYLVDLNLV